MSELAGLTLFSKTLTINQRRQREDILQWKETIQGNNDQQPYPVHWEVIIIRLSQRWKTSSDWYPGEVIATIQTDPTDSFLISSRFDWSRFHSLSSSSGCCEDGNLIKLKTWASFTAVYGSDLRLISSSSDHILDHKTMYRIIKHILYHEIWPYLVSLDHVSYNQPYIISQRQTISHHHTKI